MDDVNVLENKTKVVFENLGTSIIIVYTHVIYNQVKNALDAAAMSGGGGSTPTLHDAYVSALRSFNIDSSNDPVTFHNILVKILEKYRSNRPIEISEQEAIQEIIEQFIPHEYHKAADNSARQLLLRDIILTLLNHMFTLVTDDTSEFLEHIITKRSLLRQFINSVMQPRMLSHCGVLRWRYANKLNRVVGESTTASGRPNDIELIKSLREKLKDKIISSAKTIKALREENIKQSKIIEKLGIELRKGGNAEAVTALKQELAELREEVEVQRNSASMKEMEIEALKATIAELNHNANANAASAANTDLLTSKEAWQQESELGHSASAANAANTDLLTNKEAWQQESAARQAAHNEKIMEEYEIVTSSDDDDMDLPFL